MSMRDMVLFMSPTMVRFLAGILLSADESLMDRLWFEEEPLPLLLLLLSSLPDPEAASEFGTSFTFLSSVSALL